MYTPAYTFDFKKNFSMPHFGRSAQPQQTYFMSLLNVVICGVMAHHHPILAHEGRRLYWWYLPDVGSKNGDHTMSIILDHVILHELPDWLRPHVKRIKIFLDGARNTNWSQATCAL
jgi:hypothetical protein